MSSEARVLEQKKDTFRGTRVCFASGCLFVLSVDGLKACLLFWSSILRRVRDLDVGSRVGHENVVCLWTGCVVVCRVRLPSPDLTINRPFDPEQEIDRLSLVLLNDSLFQ